MSEISDELRDYGRRLVSNASPFNCTFGDIRAYQDELADRIDAELVELPKDADGVPIHVGDTVYGCRSGMEMTISELRMTANGWSISTSSGYLTDAKVTHTAPDSLERIANELDEQAGSLTKDGYTWQEDAIHDFADRIRKLAKEQGNE